MQQPRTILVLGGARSGKSRHAEDLITRYPPPWIYLATAQAFDDDMRARIGLHRDRRAGGWITVEEPLHPAPVLARPEPLLLDCLTLWLSNLILGGQATEPAFLALDSALAARDAPTVLVANEVGLGIVPDNALARQFRDCAGVLNQRIAARADAVEFIAAGCALRMK